MTKQWARAAVAWCLVALLAACAISVHKPLAPTLFPAQTGMAVKDPATVTLTLANRELNTTSPLRNFAGQVELPLGHIVEAAGHLALAQEFAAVAAGTTAVDARAVGLQVADVKLEVSDELIYLVPVPLPLLNAVVVQRVDVTVRLTLRARVLGPDGAARWSQDYDSGRELWVPKQVLRMDSEPIYDGVQRLAHELSVREMRHVAQDLRAWLERERLRERVL
jgi:hypothetical protein